MATEQALRRFAYNLAYSAVVHIAVRPNRVGPLGDELAAFSLDDQQRIAELVLEIAEELREAAGLLDSSADSRS